MRGERLHTGVGNSREIGIEAFTAGCDELHPVAGRDQQCLPHLWALHERVEEVRQARRVQNQLLTHGDGGGPVRKTDDDDHRLLPPLARTTYKSSTSSMHTTPAIVP